MLQVIKNIYDVGMRGVPLRKEELIIMDKLSKIKDTIVAPTPMKEQLFNLQLLLQQIKTSTGTRVSKNSEEELSSKAQETYSIISEVSSL